MIKTVKIQEAKYHLKTAIAITMDNINGQEAIVSSVIQL